MCLGFNLLRVPPSVGANRHVCITNRVLPAVLIYPRLYMDGWRDGLNRLGGTV